MKADDILSDSYRVLSYVTKMTLNNSKYMSREAVMKPGANTTFGEKTFAK